MSIDSELDIKRIQSLTDATFAVAMTLLILDVKIPSGLSHPELNRYFLKQSLPELFIYFIGFITLGVFWVGSHFHHHHLMKTDRVSSWINILFLMLICIIPFSIGFLRNYRHDQLSIIFYCINLIVAAFTNYAMLWYAWKLKYLKSHYSEKHFRNSKHRILIPVYCYALIVLISFFSTDIAIFFFLLPLVIHLIPEKANN